MCKDSKLVDCNINKLSLRVRPRLPHRPPIDVRIKSYLPKGGRFAMTDGTGKAISQRQSIGVTNHLVADEDVRLAYG